LPIDAEVVNRAAQDITPDLVRFAQDLIAIPSPSGQEGAAVDRALAEMHRLGYDEVYRDQAGNAVGRIGSGPVVIVYDSHLDTVEPASPEKWRHPPYAGIVEDGVLYGIGASDNKGGFSTLVYGGGLLKRLGIEGGFTLYVVGIVQEEHCEGLALRYFLEEQGIHPHYVLSAEATGLKIMRGHRGRTEIVAYAVGKTCHASMPHLGENAIYKALPFIEGARALADALPEDPLLGKATLVVSKIETAPDTVNAVPDTCRVYMDRRLIPGESEDDVLGPLRRLAGPAGIALEIPSYEGKSYTGTVLRGRSFFPAWILPEDNTLIRTAVRVGQSLFAQPPEIGLWTFSTDGNYSAGVLGVPTIGFGPSHEHFAHAVDDQVPVDHLTRCAAFYAAMPKGLAEATVEI
jgi:putative selenium metabolism hydrolase